MGSFLKGRVAIVTGSGQGIGKAIALAMAREGAAVITNNRRAGSPEGDAGTTAAEIKAAGGIAAPFYADVARFDHAGELIRAAVDNFGRLDILVNNAALFPTGTPWEITEEAWDRCIDSGLKGAFNCIHHASVLMRDQKWGRIINATSNAWLGTYEACAYGAAKGGIVGMTRSLARDLGKYGITCNAFAPSARTRMTVNPASIARWKGRLASGVITREQYERRVNVPLPEPETVPPFLVYLCTEHAADINGQVFSVRGGKIAYFPEPAPVNTISKEQGLWTVEELIDLVPRVMMKGYKNPAPNLPQG